MSQGDEAADGLAQFRELISDERTYEKPGTPGVDPALRRRRRRRGALIGGIVTVVILALVGVYAGYTLTAPVGAAEVSAAVPKIATPAAAKIALPAEGAAAISVAGADAYLGPGASGVWASSGGGEPRPIASISKIITAMVVLDAKPLDGPGAAGPTLRFDAADHALYDKYYVLGATIAEMPTGSSMSEHDALETMLVVSACNYAEAVAEWAFGSESAFLAAARTWLAAHGLSQTTLVEPTGVDTRNTSTPGDLLTLARLAAADPVIAGIVRMPRLDVPGLAPLPNTNDLLGVDGVSGIKTGTLDESGSNLLFSAALPVGTGDPLSVTGVMLGGRSHAAVNDDVAALLTSITNGFHDVPLTQPGQKVGRYTTPWGASAGIVVADRASVFTWSDTPITATIDTTTITTGARGDDVGRITWTAGPRTATASLALDSDIPLPSAWWRLTHPFDLGGQARSVSAG
ncbi:D-alanyl-D-alanine carboxypeptidase [Microbacterium sp. X-17]|uniref:D-alanyl-D-alanine carboxypeptidase family protein n=1 Tax=Microbacterium sp. X-17 TaxID=3144404 RepID=UPI0031F4EADB